MVLDGWIVCGNANTGDGYIFAWKVFAAVVVCIFSFVATREKIVVRSQLQLLWPPTTGLPDPSVGNRSTTYFWMWLEARQRINAVAVKETVVGDWQEKSVKSQQLHICFYKWQKKVWNGYICRLFCNYWQLTFRQLNLLCFLFLGTSNAILITHKLFI